jgi:hypothetical protein
MVIHHAVHRSALQRHHSSNVQPHDKWEYRNHLAPGLYVLFSRCTEVRTKRP